MHILVGAVKHGAEKPRITGDEQKAATLVGQLNDYTM